ncbi:MAG: hypothetical protein ACI4BI_01270 [Anaerotardibacter sp.]
MFNVKDESVRALLFKGNFGLERESLRITSDGFLAKTAHPFAGNANIIRDFAENQTEINTGINPTPAQALAEIAQYDSLIHKTLLTQEEPELIWPFSNPPYIRNENDIPIAQYYGEEREKTTYREYLSSRYGRYKMTFCGIHFNYSFADELLEADANAKGVSDFTAYKDALYLDLAQKCVAYGWLITALTAASPVFDSSFTEEGTYDEDVFMGISSVRSSELGYWNFFTPVLSYDSPLAYAQSIQNYVDTNLIRVPSELYYPVRLKPRGDYQIEKLAQGNISHIELRNLDLNPLALHGIREEDIHFAQLFLIWLASTAQLTLDPVAQVQAVANFKSASHYDLRLAKILLPNGTVSTVGQASLKILDNMIRFFTDIKADDEVLDCLAFQKAKLTDFRNSYSWQVHKAYGTNFVKKGLKLAKENQVAILGQNK